ncbi:MAG: hypothetical protein MZV70_11150 [Desulfobacterales bacterium]|nr:hypothetical protein [Desulfobacterales bacterium]
MSEKNRAELKNYLTSPESNSRFVKAISVLSWTVGGEKKKEAKFTKR